MNLEALCSRISYKPNVRIRFERRREFGEYRVELRLVVDTVDSVTGLPTEINHSYTTDERMFHNDEGAFIHWFWKCITKSELHEAQEFFKFDGKLVKDPHEGEL